MIKIKLRVNSEHQEILKTELENLGITISEDANLTLIEEDTKINQLIGKKDDSVKMINLDDIYYIESFDHNIFAITLSGHYRIKENLSLLETLLSENFVRINYSTILNITYIDHLVPLVGLRFKLILKNGDKVYVSRTYYYKFKESLRL